MTINPNSAISTFTSLRVVPDAQNLKEGNFFGFPQLTQAQIDSIPTANIQPGIAVYNTTDDSYLIWIPGTGWVAINVAGGDGNFVNLTVSNSTTTQTLDVALETRTNSLDVATTAEISALSVIGSAVFNPVTVFQVYQVIEAEGLQIGFTDAGGDNPVPGTIYGLQAPAGAPNNLSILLQPAAGTGATVVLEGSPVSGVITITTGASGISGGFLATITVPPSHPDAYTGKYGVIFTPANTDTCAKTTELNIVAHYESPSTNITPGTILLQHDGTGNLDASTAYAWNYIIIGNYLLAP